MVVGVNRLRRKKKWPVHPTLCGHMYRDCFHMSDSWSKDCNRSSLNEDAENVRCLNVDCRRSSPCLRESTAKWNRPMPKMCDQWSLVKKKTNNVKFIHFFPSRSIREDRHAVVSSVYLSTLSPLSLRIGHERLDSQRQLNLAECHQQAMCEREKSISAQTKRRRRKDREVPLTFSLFLITLRWFLYTLQHCFFFLLSALSEKKNKSIRVILLW